MECVFCKIINEKTRDFIYETKDAVSFLSRAPIAEGHALVVPKIHYENIYDIPESFLAELIIGSKKVAQIQKKTLKAEGTNIMHASGSVAGQTVFHFHIHVIPRYKSDNIKLHNLQMPWVDEEELKKIANKIKSAIT